LKFFHAASCINKLLLTSEKAMTRGTDFNLDVLKRGAGFDNIPTRTGYRGIKIFWMDILFHFLPPFMSIFVIRFFLKKRIKLKYYC
jgi:hypothetical protein